MKLDQRTQPTSQNVVVVVPPSVRGDSRRSRRKRRRAYGSIPCGQDQERANARQYGRGIVIRVPSIAEIPHRGAFAGLEPGLESLERPQMISNRRRSVRVALAILRPPHWGIDPRPFRWTTFRPKIGCDRKFGSSWYTLLIRPISLRFATVFALQPFLRMRSCPST